MQQVPGGADNAVFDPGGPPGAAAAHGVAVVARARGRENLYFWTFRQTECLANGKAVTQNLYTC